MSKESELYDKFVDCLSNKLDGEPTGKELEVVMNFLKRQNIQATTKHEGLKKLSDKVVQLPFDDMNVMPEKKVN